MRVSPFLFLRLFVPLALLLLGGAGLYGNQEIERELTLLRDQEATNVLLGAGALSNRMEFIRHDLMFLSTHSATRNAVNQPSPNNLAHLAEDFAIFSDSSGHYDQIRWIDQSGMEVVRVDYVQGKAVVVPANKLQNKGRRYFFSDTIKLNPGEIFVSPLDLNIEQNTIEVPHKPMIRIATPVADGQGRKRGIIILNYYGIDLLQAFARASVGISDHSMVVNSEGYWLKSPNPSDEWGFMFKRPELSMASRAPEVWERIRSTDRGQLELDDGMWTWETIFPLLANQKTSSADALVPGRKEMAYRQYRWKSVAHLSADTLNTIRHTIRLRTGLIAGLLLCLVGLGSWLLARSWDLLSAEKIKFRTVADFTYDWELWIDPGGHYQYCSPACERITGRSVDAFLDNPRLLIEMTHPDDRAHMETHQLMDLELKNSCMFVFRIVWPDGQVRWLEHVCQPVFGKTGEFLGRRASNRDATERIQAEAALQESERRYHFLFDNNPMPMWIFAENSRRFLEVNGRAVEHYGFTREEFSRMTLNDMRPAEGIQELDQVIANSPDGIISGGVRHKKKDGTLINVIISTMPMEYKSTAARIVLIQDVTEQKRAEEEKEGQMRNLHALVNAIQESTFLMERNGTILVINEVGAHRLKTRPEKLVGENVYDLLPPKVAQARKEKFELIAQSGKPGVLDDERAGQRFLSSIYPIFDAKGEVVRFAVYAADVTQQRRQQAIDEMLFSINQKILQGLSLHEVLTIICQKVAELFRLEVVWLGRKETGGAVSVMAVAGSATSYVEQLKIIGVRWDDTPQGRGPAGSAIRFGQTQTSRVDDPRFKLWAKIALKNNLQSILAIPLAVRGEIYGVFTLYSSNPVLFDVTALTAQINSIGKHICIALEAAMDQQRVRLLSSALEAAGNGVIITNSQGRIQWANPAFSKLCGYSNEELLGQTPRILKSGQQSSEYYRALWATISKGENWSSETVERAKDGNLYTVSQTITPIINDGEITHFIAIHEDISAQKMTQERIAHMAHYDALTGLPNRILFYDRLQQVLSQAKRNKGGLALLYMDLDGFKKINDTLGHHTGDLLLMEVAERLSSCVRESDTVARLGGDEFTIVLNETHKSEDVTVVAQKIIEAISVPFDLEGEEARIGISIGIARYSEKASNEEELMKRADQAMYEAKLAGKNTYRFSTPG